MAMINIKASINGKVPYDTSFVLSIINLIICAVELIAMTLFLMIKHRKKQLRDKKSKKRCGYVYKDLSYRIQGGWALAYPIVYQIRFIILVYVVLFLSDNVICQVLLMALSTIFVIAIIGMHHPFKILRQNYMQMASEIVILITIDLLLFSSTDIDPNDR